MTRKTGRSRTSQIGTAGLPGSDEDLTGLQEKESALKLRTEELDR